jgi:hypothetical protein
MKPKGLLSCFQEPSTGSYSEQHESNPIHTPYPISLK